DGVWSRALEALRGNESLSPQNRSFIRLVKPLAVVDDNVFLAVAEDFTKNYLDTQLRGPVTDALRAVMGREVRFAVTVDSSVIPPETGDDDDHEPTPQRKSGKRPPTVTEDPH